MSADASTRDRHALTGRSVRLDPRIDPVRADLTDIRLADRVFAPHYALAMPRSATMSTPIRAAADAKAAILSELLPGDGFDLLEVSHDIAWGLSTTDGVVGYVSAATLDEPVVPSHRVIVREAALREAPDANAKPMASLPMGARVATLGERGRFLLTDHGYVSTDDVAILDQPVGTLAEAALALVGVPEHRGGRSSAGVDAAGLIFLAHDRHGICVPRLADLQQEALNGDGDVLWFETGSAIRVDADHAVAMIDGNVTLVPLADLIEAGRLGALVAQGKF